MSSFFFNHLDYFNPWPLPSVTDVCLVKSFCCKQYDALLLIVNLRSKFLFMLGGIIPLIHYQEPVCISYQINLIL